LAPVPGAAERAPLLERRVLPAAGDLDPLARARQAVRRVFVLRVGDEFPAAVEGEFLSSDAGQWCFRNAHPIPSVAATKLNRSLSDSAQARTAVRSALRAAVALPERPRVIRGLSLTRAASSAESSSRLTYPK